MNASPLLHPTDQTLQAYGLGKLDEASVATIDTHLEACEDCRRRVSEISGDSFLGRLRAGAATAPDAPANGRADDALPEELLSQYELVRELGRGGMGVVWLARNKLLDRLEALKILNRAMLERRGTLDRFLREIRVVARLNHENIVRAYSAHQVGDALVFVLEYVEGMDLARLVKQRGPLPVAHASYFAHQAALGLQHAHERGMVHRDIKPGNLILYKQGQRAIVKVLDFGLAKALSEQSVDGSLTHEGQMLGTPDYIAPEQTLDAQKADIRADVYSLGCTLYYLLSGAPPFSGTSLYDILQAHHSMDARPLNLLRPEVPIELAAAVGKMMAKDPARRFQTPAEVAKALTPFFKKTGASPAAPAQPSPGDAPPIIAPTLLPTTRSSAQNAWRSLIDFDKSDHAPESQTAPASIGRGARRRWPLAAAAAGFGAVLLGVIISLSIRKDKDGFAAKARLRVTPNTRMVTPNTRIVTPGTRAVGPTDPKVTAAPGPPAGTNEAAGSDPFQPDTVWATRVPPEITLTVQERTGEQFRGWITLKVNEVDTIREVRGTVADGTVRWRGDDVRVIVGEGHGHDNDGTLHNGDELRMSYSGGGQQGTYTLYLQQRDSWP